MQIPKFKLKSTLFANFNVSDYERSDVNFDLLTKMFCRREEEIKAEEELRKNKKAASSKPATKFVLES